MYNLQSCFLTLVLSWDVDCPKPPVWHYVMSDLPSSPPPKIVFNRLNGKRYHSASTQKVDCQAEGFTPAHEENVRFVYEGEDQ